VHEFSVADIDTDVIDRVPTRGEEHEIAGQQVRALHAHRRALLQAGRARNADAGMRIREGSEARTVEAVRRVATVAIDLANLAQRLPCDRRAVCFQRTRRVARARCEQQRQRDAK
jgi:hypothetical protein